MPPPLKRPAYWVWISPDGVDPDAATDDQLEAHHVVIHHADQLRAELEANKQGLPKGATSTPMHLTALWLWAAMVRLEVFSGGFRDFKSRCVAYDPDKDRDAPHTDDTDDTDELDAHPTAASMSSG